ncbi:MAG: hypothetical protein VX015_04765 [Planctomycetota bacterium]|nr:hypothetical protein [Planctomycetota bacterium]
MLAPLALALLSLTVLPQRSEQPAFEVHVIDAVTGEPVEGARVHGVHEIVAPVWSDFWFRQAALPTNARGVASLAPSTADAKYSWTIVRAEGYAPSGTFWTPQPDTPVEVELWPVVPSRIKLLDHTGAPLGLVHLGVAVGCGHTPDVTSTVTDPLGGATLHAVGREGWEIADVYPVGETVRTTYLDVEWEAANEGVYETMAAPGARLDGVVLDAQGRPLADIAVGQLDTHRGPWAVTDERGHFRLYGLEPQVCDRLEVRDLAGNRLMAFEKTRMGMKRILRLAPERFGEERVGETTALEVGVEVFGETSGSVPVLLWDVKTGWLAEKAVPVGESVTFDLIEGVYEVEVGGRGTPYERTRLGRHEVGPTRGDAELRSTLGPVVRRRLELLDVGDATRVIVVTASGARFDVPFDEVVRDDATGLERGVVDAFAIPCGRYGLWLEPRDRFRALDPIDLEPMSSERVLRGQRRP